MMENLREYLMARQSLEDRPEDMGYMGPEKRAKIFIPTLF